MFADFEEEALFEVCFGEQEEALEVKEVNLISIGKISDYIVGIK